MINEENSNQSDQKPIMHEPIVVRPRELTDTEREIQNVSTAVRQQMVDRMSDSKSLDDFILNYYAIRSHDRGNIDWMWQQGKAPTVDDVMNFFYAKEMQKRASTDSQVAEELNLRLDDFSEEEGQVAVVLKRVRDSHGRYQYGILARFPKGVPSENPFFGWTPVEEAVTNPDTIYFAPTTPCVLHAADDLFKIYRQDPFRIPYRDRNEAISGLVSKGHGINEYVVDKTDDRTIKQDAGNYILVGLQSAYSNEPFVAPVSRFKSTT